MAENEEQAWTIERVQKLIDSEVEEGLRLEYKAGAWLANRDTWKEGLTRYVSAFANAAGGTLILGVAEYKDRDREHLPEKIDPVDRATFSRERIEQVINGSIFPRIANVRIYPVPADGAANGYVYVVEVPQGETAHQSKDRRYHRRYNFEVLPMEDHEIRDVMNRAQHPRIDLNFRFSREFAENRYINMLPRLEVVGRNVGAALARLVCCKIYIPEQVWGRRQPGLDRDTRVFMRDIDGERYVLWQVSAGMGSEAEGPALILPELEFEDNLLFTRETSPNTWRKSPAKIIWQVHADNSPVRRGDMLLADIPWIHEYDSPRPEHDVKPGQTLSEGDEHCSHEGVLTQHSKERGAWRAKCTRCEREVVEDDRERALVSLVSEDLRDRYSIDGDYRHDMGVSGEKTTYTFRHRGE